MEAKEDEEEAKEVGTTEDVDKLSRRQVKVTKEHNAECQKLLKLMGIPCIIVGDRFTPSCRKNLLVHYAHNRHRQKLRHNAPSWLEEARYDKMKLFRRLSIFRRINEADQSQNRLGVCGGVGGHGHSDV